MLAEALQVRKQTVSTQYTWRAKPHFDAMVLDLRRKQPCFRICPANNLGTAAKYHGAVLFDGQDSVNRGHQLKSKRIARRSESVAPNVVSSEVTG
jgi:hypothetical protein